MITTMATDSMLTKPPPITVMAMNSIRIMVMLMGRTVRSGSPLH